jgi:uncharacterized protein YbjQ (UPF0145 family)
VSDNVWDGRGLPPVARARIARAAAEGVRTSLLSTGGAVSLQSSGFEIVGEVLGSTVMQIGWTGFGGCGWGGLRAFGLGGATTVTSSRQGWAGYAPYVDALKAGRDTALNRLLQEASALGADGVVGVRLQFNNYAFEENVLEFQAIGTAVRHESGEHYRTRDNRPFTSDLSGQDFWKLVETGYRPVTLAMGACVYHIRHMGLLQSLQTMGRNTELTVYSEATYTARELALERMQAEAIGRGASGIVGVNVTENTWGWGANAIEFFAIGTGVVEHREPSPQLPSTVFSIGLNG